MPPKNETLTLGSGFLYIQAPGCEDPVPIGKIESLELAPEEQEWMNHPIDGQPPLMVSRSQEFSFSADLGALNLPGLWLLTRDPGIPIVWAKEHHPRLLHLCVFAKKRRARIKNSKRLARLFAQAVYGRKLKEV